MKPLAYAASLLPQFGKNRLEEDIRMLGIEYNTVTIPAYKDALVVFKEQPTSKKILQMQAQFFNIKGMPKGKTMIAAIGEKLAEIKPTLALLERVVENEFEVQIISVGITLQKATVLRMLELCSFVSTFSLRLLNYCYILESAEKSGGAAFVAGNTTADEIRLIETHVIDFALALNALAQPEDKIDKTLKSIPDVLVNERGQAALDAVAQPDPLQVFQVQGFTYNPIYHIGLIVAQIEAERYKRNKDLKTILELRLLQLERSRTNEPDAGLEREISTLQSRIDRLTYNLKKVEESVQ